MECEGFPTMRTPNSHWQFRNKQCLNSYNKRREEGGKGGCFTKDLTHYNKELVLFGFFFFLTGEEPLPKSRQQRAMKNAAGRSDLKNVNRSKNKPHFLSCPKEETGIWNVTRKRDVDRCGTEAVRGWVYWKLARTCWESETGKMILKEIGVQHSSTCVSTTSIMQHEAIQNNQM